MATSVLDAVARVRSANPASLYCCDPVIGDAGRVYVRDDIPALIAAQAVPQADVLTPNQFELERLTGMTCTDRASVRRALGALRGQMRQAGPRAVLLTSAALDDTPGDALDIVAADADGTHALRVPKLMVAASGAGDLIAALFLHALLRMGGAANAMVQAAASTHGVLRATAAAGARDLLLIEAQSELVAPSRVFQAQEF